VKTNYKQNLENISFSKFIFASVVFSFYFLFGEIRNYHCRTAFAKLLILYTLRTSTNNLVNSKLMDFKAKLGIKEGGENNGKQKRLYSK
jgi:hypothetical protein